MMELKRAGGLGERGQQQARRVLRLLSAESSGCARAQSAQVSRLLHRLHVYGLVAKIPRSRRWRVSASGYRIMSASLRLRAIHFPSAHADAGKAA